MNIQSSTDQLTITNLSNYMVSDSLPVDMPPYPYSPPITYDPWYQAEVPIPTDEIPAVNPIMNAATELPPTIQPATSLPDRQEMQMPPADPVVNTTDILPIVSPRPENTYISGTITDEKGNPINNATLALRISGSDKDEEKPVQYYSNTYTIEIPPGTDTATYGFMFRAPGYRSLFVPLDTLIDHPNITLSTAFPVWAVIAVIAAVALYRKQTKKVGGLQTGDIFPIFLLVGGGIALVVVIKILQKLGLIGGGKKNSETENPNSAFKPTYWKQFTSFSYAISTATAKEYARQIHDAFTVFQDDYNAILNVFSRMRTKANVSFVADVFSKEYGEDLLNFLSDGGGIMPWDGLSNEHMNELIDMVNKLPSN